VPMFVIAALLLTAPLQHLRPRSASEVGRQSSSKLSLICVDEVGPNIPVKLIVFDFDETITVNSVLGEYPDLHIFKQTILAGPRNPFRNGQHMERAFEGPRMHGNFGFLEGLTLPKQKHRLTALSNMLKTIREPEETAFEKLTSSGTKQKKKPAMAILTYNVHGPVAVLNTLDSVGLADNFEAIWGLWPVVMGDRFVYGVYRDSEGVWRPSNVVPPKEYVEPALNPQESHKATMIRQILRAPQTFGLSEAADLEFENVVLVDNAIDNLQGMMRSVHVYSDFRRHPVGVLEIGGIGYWDKSDFETLSGFIRNPALFAHRGPGSTVRRTFSVEPAREPAEKSAKAPRTELI